MPNEGGGTGSVVSCMFPTPAFRNFSALASDRRMNSYATQEPRNRRKTITGCLSAETGEDFRATLRGISTSLELVL